MTAKKKKPLILSLCIQLALLLALIIPQVGLAQGKPDDFQKVVKDAAKAYSSGKYDTALQKYQEAYSLNPMTALLYNMGRVYESKADFPSAIAYYTQFVSSADVDHDARTEALERINALQQVMNLNPNAANAPAAAPPQGPSAAPAARAAGHAGCIDINTADVSQIRQLKGLGPKKAQDVLDSRNAQGPFKSVSDIARVKGIGPKTVEKFADQLCPVGGGGGAVAAPTTPAAPTRAPAGGGSAKAAAPAGCIDINTADVSQIRQLRGLGPKKAQDVLDSRNAQGPFKSASDIARVKGIGPKTVEKFADQLCPVGGGGAPVAAPATPAAPTRAPAAAGGAKAAAQAGCIDINTADVSQIRQLKGLGPKKAQDVLDSRNAQGPFKSASDISRVKGIGPKTVEKFADQLCPISGGGAAAAPAAAKPAPARTSAPAPARAPAAKPKASASADEWDI